MTSKSSGATTRPSFAWRPDHLVTYGQPFPELLKTQVERLGKKRAFAIVSGSLSKNHPDKYEDLKKALGDKLVGERIGMKTHSDWQEILDVVKKARELNADIIVTLGGGSITDATKIISLVLSNPSATSLSALEDLRVSKSSNKPTVPVICIPTTLSAGEYSQFAGGTDPRDGNKKMFGSVSAPDVVILDPSLAKFSPEWVWISSGVRAVDHCVEALCRPGQPDEEADDEAEKGLVLLMRGLLNIKKNPNSEESWLETQLGANYSMDSVCKMIPSGGSHAIGHHLGPLGVAHGHTSCILNPAVMKYNESVNAKQQSHVLSILRSDPTIASTFSERGIPEDASLSTVLDGLFRQLGMPRTLKEVGIDGNDKQLMMKIAKHTMKDPWAKTNPRPLEKPEQVLEILKMVV